MTSFGWKRKAGEKVCKQTVLSFIVHSKDEADAESSGVDWLNLLPKRRALSLEDAVSKSERLKAEGVLLAEAERFWEAVKKWDEALQLTPYNEKIMEMKAQAFMAVGEVLPAVQVAERVVELSPMWWVGHQTLGRAQVNIGEVTQAFKSFSRAVHLNPADAELWVEDLLWTKSLLDRRKLVSESEIVMSSSVTVTELSDGREREMSLIAYSGDDYNSGAVLDGRDGVGCLRKLPRNYIHMRDPT